MKTKEEKPKELTAMQRQLAINNKNSKGYEIKWKLTKGDLGSVFSPDTGQHEKLTEGKSTMYADNPDTAITRFQSAYHIIGRRFKIISCEEIKFK